MRKLIYVFLVLLLIIGCKTPHPQYIPVETVRTVTETLRDTVIQVKLEVHNDTVALPDTVSYLKNKYVESWAKYSKGLLMHSLKILDTPIPVKATVKDIQKSDTIRVPYPVKGDPVLIEKELSWWQALFIWTGGITWIIIIIGLIVWTNKRTSWISGLFKLIKP
jgi:hypothetical protein